MAIAHPHVEHLVVDSGGFIRNVSIKDIGENVWTIPQVINEIRDKSTRQRLQVLPYELKFREPSRESVTFVSNFTKKTGDYGALSAVDLRLLALAYQLETEHVGKENIRELPQKVEMAMGGKTIAVGETIGFYAGGKGGGHDDEEDVSNAVGQSETLETATDDQDELAANDQPENGQLILTSDLSDDDEVIEEETLSEDGVEDDDEDNKEDSEGWITPSNLKAARRAMGVSDRQEQKKEVKVACLTTDFAMQNVLLQMGLSVISTGGMITQARSYIMRCHACMKTTPNVSLKFCPACGNPTLKRISVSVGSDGKITMHFSKRKAPTTRGTKFSLPTPRGGKHCEDPILCPDEVRMGSKPARTQNARYDALEPDYVANSSPFAPHDITSRAAVIGVKSGQRQRNKRNPNENRKVYGRRK